MMFSVGFSVNIWTFWVKTFIFYEGFTVFRVYREGFINLDCRFLLFDRFAPGDHLLYFPINHFKFQEMLTATGLLSLFCLAFASAEALAAAAVLVFLLIDFQTVSFFLLGNKINEIFSILNYIKIQVRDIAKTETVHCIVHLFCSSFVCLSFGH